MMPIATSGRDIIALLAVGFVVFGLTAGLVKVLGVRIASRSRVLAFLTCGLAVPIALIGLAFLQLHLARKLPPPNDAPAMMFIAIATLAVLTIPVSLATSGAMIFRQRKRT